MEGVQERSVLSAFARRLRNLKLTLAIRNIHISDILCDTSRLSANVGLRVWPCDVEAQGIRTPARDVYHQALG